MLNIFTVRHSLCRPVLLFAACFGMVLSMPANAYADEWLEQAQRDFGLVTGNQSAEQVLFPLLVKMDPFPIGNSQGSYAVDRDYLFIPRGDARRQRMVDWVNRPAQQAVLEAVRMLADESDSYMFSLQLGRDKVPSEWAEADLYIEAGFDNLLVLAEYRYVDPLLDRLRALYYSNGIAKAGAGKGDEALEDYSKVMMLGRMLLNRPSHIEKLYGVLFMRSVGSFMCDLVYQYTRPGDTSFTSQGIADAVLEIDEQFLRIRQMQLPTIEAYSARQFFDKASQGGRRIDPGRYSVMMAMVMGKNGINRFGFASGYRNLAMVQADRLDFERQYNDLLADFTRRWSYSNLHDPLLRVPPVARRMDITRFDILDEFMNIEYTIMFTARLQLLTDLAGTRSALATVAFYLENRNLPGRLVAIQPRFLRSLNTSLDFIAYNQRIQASEPLRYWVPIRDEQFGARETPTPYPIRVVFSEDGMVSYSPGARPATRSRDLMNAIPFPGFGTTADNLAIGGEGAFNAGDLGSLIGFSASGFSDDLGRDIAQDLLSGTTIQQFGLSQRDHVAFEEYLAGETDSFNFQALRDLVKRQSREEPPTDRDAQQFSVYLAGLQALGITLDTAGSAVREQLESLLAMASADGSGMDFGDLDPSDFEGIDFGGTDFDDMDFGDMDMDLGDMGILGMFMGGDLNEMLTNATGRNANQIIDYIVGVVDRLAQVQSLRDAVEGANRGEFLTARQLTSMTDDLIDVIISPEVMTPLRDMLVHFRKTDFGQQAVVGLELMNTGATDVVFAIDDSSFLLYSVWSNRRDDRAALIETGNRGDMLYWPPALSLYREYRNR